MVTQFKLGASMLSVLPFRPQAARAWATLCKQSFTQTQPGGV